jgi:hypothetical protein
MPTIPLRTELTLPNDANALRIARACAHEIVALAELPPDESEKTTQCRCRSLRERARPRL